MTELKPGWEIIGIYNEACASEGHCPYYFGRDKEGGCRYFMVFRITEGKVNDVDLSGITAIYTGDLPHSTYAEVQEKGSEGAIYISDHATPAQREVLDTLAVEALGGAVMKKVLGTHYVGIDIHEDKESVHFKMPSGEMRMELTRSRDGNPVRLENPTLPFISNVRAAHTPFWSWSDHDRHFEYRNRCGTWADFAMASMPG
ncbi:MAG TPA: DUF1326 domain-containing protein [Desulfobacteraceae bacterium]|nr:DUF1326 domain-containing protein [Desulfobacteraceae bacterium]